MLSIDEYEKSFYNLGTWSFRPLHLHTFPVPNKTFVHYSFSKLCFYQDLNNPENKGKGRVYLYMLSIKIVANGEANFFVKAYTCKP